jgi:hypothetical protein
MKRRIWLSALVALSFLVGCSSLSPEEQSRRDRVLGEYREAATTMRAGDFAKAKPLLDDAVLTLGGISAGDKTARGSRSYFREESTKSFRGEPYERVMAYYYRGIIYWMDGEPDNARACFRSAALQDADPENGQYESDWVLLDYLDGLASVKLNGDGADALRRAQTVARINRPPAYDKQANVLVFAETGHGPGKFAAGQYSEQLHFSPGGANAVTAQIRITDANLVAVAPSYDDLTFQATTRGGRQMDYVLANKAVFKGATDSFGNAALVSGGVLATAGQGRHGAADEVGLGLVAAGLVSKLFSAATTPAADTRAWDNLPNLLGFTALRVPPGRHTATVEFQNPAHQTTATRQLTFEVVAGRDTVLFVSDRN